MRKQGFTTWVGLGLFSLLFAIALLAYGTLTNPKLIDLNVIYIFTLLGLNCYAMHRITLIEERLAQMKLTEQTT